MGPNLKKNIYRKALEIEVIEEDKKTKATAPAVTAVTYKAIPSATATGRTPVQKSRPNRGIKKTIQCRCCNKFGTHAESLQETRKGQRAHGWG